MSEGMAQRIKNLRQEKGLTLEQVAEVVGVGKSTVRKWETGMIANMRRDKIADLAKALGTTPAYLMGWEEQSDLTAHEHKVISAYRRKPEMQPAVDRLLGVEDDELIAVPVAARSENNKPVGIAYISKEKLEQLNNAKCVADEVDL